MKRGLKLGLIGVLALGLAACDSMKDDKMAKSGDQMAAKESHAHIGHVMTGWTDTPGKAGLLPTAMDEAKIALQHAQFAVSKPTDMDWIKLHITHVANAIDPSVEPEGPGKGYGVLKAATGAAKHIGFAAGSAGASKNVKLHAEHVAASANNAVERAMKVIELTKKVKETDSLGAAISFAREIQYLCEEIIAGTDIDDDGKVTWIKGEGGLDVAGKHMGFMMKGEGLGS